VRRKLAAEPVKTRLQSGHHRPAGRRFEGQDVNRFQLIIVLAAASLFSSGFSQTFTTRFEGAENPLFEDGKWTNRGVDWTHIQKESGIACGTQTGTNTGIYKFNDSYAHLSGFPPDQEAWGEAHIAKPNPSCTQELEILLRWTSSAHRTTGYECFARCLSSSSSYVQIVRWDGPLGKFTYLADKRGTNYGLKNGDILKASIVGNVITVYLNGVEKARATDDTYRTGDPGIGEFLACDRGQGIGSNSDFGFASFTARGLGKPFHESRAIERGVLLLGPGQTVSLPAGVFTITEPIRLRSGARLIGAGPDKTIVHYAGAKPGVMISLQDCEDIEVAHLTLDAQNNTNVQQGISAGNARRLMLHHLGVRNLGKGAGFGPHGILFSGVNPTRTSGVTDSEISDCLVENIAPDAPFGCGIRFAWGSSRNRALRNTVRRTGRGGIFGDNGSSDLLIRSNVVAGSGGEGLGIEVWGHCDRAVIEDNQVDHWLSIGGSDYCAVRRNVVSDKSGVVKFIGLEGIGAHCVYTDNVVDDGQQIGISVSNTAAKDYAYWGDNAVHHCIQWAAQFQGEQSGIAFHYFYRCKFNHTSASRGQAIYPRDAGHGFRTNGNVRDCVFEECEFADNDGYGVQFGGEGLDAFSFLRCAVRRNKGPAMAGLRDYRALEWVDCTIAGNLENSVRPQKPFRQPAPIAAFRAPATGRVGEPIHFVNESRAAQGQIAAVLWDFNDGAPVSEANPTHVYTQAGEYRVTLIVWNELGRAARAQQRLRIG
jgi:hypothetical protein